MVNIRAGSSEQALYPSRSAYTLLIVSAIVRLARASTTILAHSTTPQTFDMGRCLSPSGVKARDECRALKQLAMGLRPRRSISYLRVSPAESVWPGVSLSAARTRGTGPAVPVVVCASPSTMRRAFTLRAWGETMDSLRVSCAPVPAGGWARVMGT